MATYDRTYKPPAPVTRVTVCDRATGLRSASLLGKLDTGADSCAIPAALVTELDLESAGMTWVRGFDGRFSRIPFFYVDLSIEGCHLPGVRGIATDRSNVLLGRIVLNQFLITLDGKNLNVRIEDP